MIELHLKADEIRNRVFCICTAAWDAKGYAGIASKRDANSKGQTKSRSHYGILMKQDVGANPEQTSLE
jgi:hypothetical protein